MKLKQTPLSKITKPHLPKIFSRARLFRLLDRQRNVPVTRVSGPAGSGKTTLVASWLEARKLPCLWYQTDEGDADIANRVMIISRSEPPPALTGMLVGDRMRIIGWDEFRFTQDESRGIPR